MKSFFVIATTKKCKKGASPMLILRSEFTKESMEVPKGERLGIINRVDKRRIIIPGKYAYVFRREIQ